MLSRMLKSPVPDTAPKTFTGILYRIYKMLKMSVGIPIF